MAQRRVRAEPSAPAIEHVGEPLFAIPFDDEGKDFRFFWTPEEADAAVTEEMIQRTLATVSTPIAPNFDWDEFDAAMARIGHETPPTPPIELDQRADDRLDSATSRSLR